MLRFARNGLGFGGNKLHKLDYVWRNDEDIIFPHTGGAPAPFVYQTWLGI